MSEIPDDILAAANEFDTLYGNGRQGYVVWDIAVLAIIAERERCAKIAEEYSIMAHAAYDMKHENFPQKSPVHTFIASEIRGDVE